MKLYSCSAIDNLIQQYAEKGGVSYEIEEGVLGYGLTVCIADGYKSAVIKEVPLNQWSSAHKVRFYNSLPKKYAKQLGNCPHWEIWSVKPIKKGESENEMRKLPLLRETEW